MERTAYVWDSMMTFLGDLIKQRLSNDIEFIIKKKNKWTVNIHIIVAFYLDPSKQGN